MRFAHDLANRLTRDPKIVIHGNSCFILYVPTISYIPIYMNMQAQKLAFDSQTPYHVKVQTIINTLRPRQNGRHFTDDIFKCIFLNENVWIPIKISLKFVPQGPINNIPALVLIMAWRRPGDKPLSGPMMVRLPTHICVTRPQWVKCVQARKKIKHTCIYVYTWQFREPLSNKFKYNKLHENLPSVFLWYYQTRPCIECHRVHGEDEYYLGTKGTCLNGGGGLQMRFCYQQFCYQQAMLQLHELINKFVY